MTEPLRAVLDTNVWVSALLSKNPLSPTRELIARWQRLEFDVITCDAIADEMLEKLLERAIDSTLLVELIATLESLADWIVVGPEAIEPVLPDPDDDVVLACAVLGRATHLVTYDPHFDVLAGTYRGVAIVKALPFLWLVRGDTPPHPA